MNIHSMYDGDGDWINGGKKSDFNNADILVMPGGSDVSPQIYKHKPISVTYSNYKQDIKEVALMRAAFNENKLIIGICKSLN